MALFEIVIALLAAGALLAAWARKLGAPYPAFLALAGVGLALIPSAPVLTLEPDLVLALFVAPVLLDTAFDSSPRDLRKFWRPIAGGAIVAVILTVIAVALVARWLQPDMPWAVAITLGAIVAPPDASAAIAVLRALRPPHRVMVIIEGESLLNDATALLIYRVSVAAALGHWAGWAAMPGLVLAISGGIVLGFALGRLFPRASLHIEDVPTSVIIQFSSTFGVWIIAERLGLSPVVMMVSYAITVARTAPARMGARRRVQSYAVWDVAVFVLNVLAFILIGLQLRPILAALKGVGFQDYALFGGATLLTAILTRVVWVMTYNLVARWRNLRFGGRPGGSTLLPTRGNGIVIAWCGMRGIVTLATALALPAGADGMDFPFRGLILFAAFAVVLGTLVLQGLTLRPLMQLLSLPYDGAVEREVRLARNRTAQAALASLARDDGPLTDAIRQEYAARMPPNEGAAVGDRSDAGQLGDVIAARKRALAAERQALLALRGTGEIGDDAFHAVEEEIDWADMNVEGRLERG